jgi:hypothetical protein
MFGEGPEHYLEHCKLNFTVLIPFWVAILEYNISVLNQEIDQTHLSFLIPIQHVT